MCARARTDDTNGKRESWNELDEKSEGQIKLQSYLRRKSYGGVSTSILPLTIKIPTVESKRNLLYEDTVAFLQIERQASGNTIVRQLYRGLVNGQFQVMGENVFMNLLENPTAKK